MCGCVAVCQMQVVVVCEDLALLSACTLGLSLLLRPLRWVRDCMNNSNTALLFTECRLSKACCLSSSQP